MEFNQHLELHGKHAFLSGSNYHWINYTPDKLERVYINQQAKDEGTALHAFAEMAIRKKIKLAKLKKAINMFVNDAIGFKMVPEQVLYYSENCFGTADAILFKDNFLRIHDLKTGFSKTSFKQLEIYTAIFCLEYSVDPASIEIEHRIYQNREATISTPDPEFIQSIMNQIVEFDMIIDRMKYIQ